MADLSKLSEREEIARWAHPELADYVVGDAASDEFFDVMYNIEKPFDERAAAANAYVDELKSWWPGGGSENARVFDVPGCPEEPETGSTVTVYFPSDFDDGKTYPCIMYIPAGGLVACMDFFLDGEGLANRYGAVVACCAYRSLYENGIYPHPVNDLHAAFAWLVEHAQEISIDPDKIVLNGESSGGHLALALCHRLKRYGLSPRGCLVESPIVDDRAIYPSSRLKHAMGGRELHAMSQVYLGHENACPITVSPEAFPNHATPEDCIGLPPTIIYTAESEVCSDPVMEYASKLVQAGVFTGVHLWAGSTHSAFSTATAQEELGELARIYQDLHTKQMRDFFDYDLRRPWVSELID